MDKKGAALRREIVALKREFDRVHAEGIASLRSGDYDLFEVVIKKERAILSRQRALVRTWTNGAVAKHPVFRHAQFSANERLLLREQQLLRTEHARLKRNPRDIAGHREHRRRLRAHIARLRDHVKRIRKTFPR